MRLRVQEPEDFHIALPENEEFLKADRVNGHNPWRYRLEFCLWKCALVATLIGQRLDIRRRVTAVGELLTKLDLTPQKLLHSDRPA